MHLNRDDHMTDTSSSHKLIYMVNYQLRNVAYITFFPEENPLRIHIAISYLKHGPPIPHLS